MATLELTKPPSVVVFSEIRVTLFELKCIQIEHNVVRRTLSGQVLKQRMSFQYSWESKVPPSQSYPPQ